jgi:hypothetical protein
MRGHDEVYLRTYRQCWDETEGSLADKLNAIAAMRGAQKNRGNWAYGIFRRTTIPYISDRAYSIAASLSVSTRLFNRFVSSLICDGDTKLSDMPTDRGACLKPIGIRSLEAHMRYYLKELMRMCSSRMAKRQIGQPAPVLPLPQNWRDCLDLTNPFYAYPASVKRKQAAVQHHRELLCILMLECLQKRYRNIIRGIDFSSETG